MELIKLRRSNAKGQVTRAVNFVDTIDEFTHIEQLEVRLDRLNEAWNNFCALHDECLRYIPNGESSDEAEREFADYESKYYYAHSGLSRALKTRQTTSHVDANESVLQQIASDQVSFLERLNCSSNTCSNISLPKITIPSFSGNYKDWPSFRDLYLGSVGNKTTLTPTQKFQYLRSFLRDDAANVIKHIPVSDANYVEAWDRLEARYNRSQVIVKSFIQTYLSLPSMSTSNVQILRNISDGADEVVRGLKALNKTSRDPWLIYLLTNKLDPESKQAWAEHVGSRDDCTIDELLKFLQSRCDALESCQLTLRPSCSRPKSASVSLRAHVTETGNNIQCPKCKDTHHLSRCPKFLSLDIQSRRHFVKTESLCFNCLRNGHSSGSCRSTFRCRVCRSRHHSLVHPEESNTNKLTSMQAGQTSISSITSIQPISSSNSNLHSSPIVNNLSLDTIRRKQTILPTVLASIRDSLGNLIVCRVLLDSGSQSSFVTESLVLKLGYPRTHAKIPILGLSSVDAGYTRGRVTLHLSSPVSSASLLIDAYIMTKLTSNLPPKSIDPSYWPHLAGLTLADPDFSVSSPIDIILGAEKLWAIIKGDQKTGPEGSPIALNTSFGWVVSGEVFAITDFPTTSLSSLHSSMDIDCMLHRFWEIEEVSAPYPDSLLQDPAEKHFRETIRRAPDGKYVVSLPFKVTNPTFNDTLTSAVAQLKSLERRFRLNPSLQRLYTDFMNEYLQLGHMTLIPPEEVNLNRGRQFYLPHHAVVKSDNSSMKIRVVFNGSAKDSAGVSLNSLLLIGPPIQRDLFGVCLRFRQRPFVFTADVVKMFRQIWVDNNQTDFQRSVWRKNPVHNIQHYRLRTVTYGTASAPFLSVRVLKQLAEDYQAEYPFASKVLLEDVYVDDVMTGADSADELIALKSELVSLLSRANLQLRKWSSNCWPLLSTLPTGDCEHSTLELESSNSIIKVLGTFWNPSSDDFSFRVSKQDSVTSATRRTLLSEVSRIFDTLGLLAPSIILFKILFQELWSTALNLGWDDPLPSTLAQRWMNYREELHHFESVRVPRHIFAPSEAFELHGFSDASSVAYAAVIYSRFQTSNGDYRVNIIAAKTKVAPLKLISIPRLELCGALLLTRLFHLITSSLTIKPSRIFAWCDSEIVLHWLSSPPRRWATFVANRVSAIQEDIPRNCWQYISSESNPADCASRGILPSALPSHTLWWTGPSWLSADHSFWPKSKFNVEDINIDNLEERLHPNHSLIVSIPEDKSDRTPVVDKEITIDFEFVDSLFRKFSSWSRLYRVIATCFRYRTNCRLNKLGLDRLTKTFSVQELREAKNSIVKLAQFIDFANDIRALKRDKTLPPKSKLLKYAPFIDKYGILRVGGRLRHSHVSVDIKHPVILCSKHPISTLIVTDIHRRCLHTGVSETFSIVRQQFWILGSRNLIRSIIFKCRTCFLQRRETTHQLMGDLPTCRIQPCRAFTNTGCDYAGPIPIRLSKTRNAKTAKGYIALFICMATEAIHLEAVSDLTSDAFLAALRRFIARRGKCSNMYSDNGTNFQGARRCLSEMQKLAVSQSHNNLVAAELAAAGIAWHFSPPSAPHFGGLWEAGVKSVKFHLRRVVGSAILVFEDLCTILCQIEPILNSRPLCSLSDSDLEPLTPAHSHIRQKPTTNMKVGDVVVLKEPNLPPTQWVMGRIIDVSPGQDERVRVVLVKTATGTFTRPITKLAVLPTS